MKQFDLLFDLKMLDLKEDQKDIFYDIMINYFMNNPVLYDKMEDEYIYTVEKISKIKILSNYLKDIDINLGGITIFIISLMF